MGTDASETSGGSPSPTMLLVAGGAKLTRQQLRKEDNEKRERERREDAEKRRKERREEDEKRAEERHEDNKKRAEERREDAEKRSQEQHKEDTPSSGGSATPTMLLDLAAGASTPATGDATPTRKQLRKEDNEQRERERREDAEKRR